MFKIDILVTWGEAVMPRMIHIIDYRFHWIHCRQWNTPVHIGQSADFVTDVRIRNDNKYLKEKCKKYEIELLLANVAPVHIGQPTTCCFCNKYWIRNYNNYEKQNWHEICKNLSCNKSATQIFHETKANHIMF